MASPSTLGAPPRHEAGAQPDSADVLPFATPHQPDGDFFDPGYMLVPAEDHGSFLSPDRLARFPLGLAVGLGKATLDVARHYAESRLGIGNIGPERKVYEVGGTERVALVTEPDPETGVNPKEAKVDFVFWGLTEMDIGSGLSFHKAQAARHPDRRVVSCTTPGVDLTGKALSIAEGFDRSLDVTADENMEIVHRIAGDNPVGITAVSMGTHTTMRMAIKNLAAGEGAMMNIDRLELGSPAIGGRDAPESVKLHEQDAADKELIDRATDEFMKHMPGNIWEMIKSRPEQAARCAAVIMGYLFEPHKLPGRGAAIAGNLRGVQEGIDWVDLVAVAQRHPVHVVGGELDPLMRLQLPQYVAIKDQAPTTRIRLMQGLGHAMTIDGPRIVEQFDQMNQERTGLVLAAA